MTRLIRGVVHYASFPAARTDTAVFWSSLGTLLDDPEIGAIELATELPANSPGSLRSAFTTAGKRLMLSAGPRLIGEPGLCALDPTERARALELGRSLVDLASEVGAANLMLVSGRDPERPDQRPAALDALRDSIAHLAAHAAEVRPDRSLTISIETFARDRAPAMLVGPTIEALRVIDQLAGRHDNIRLTLDLAHLVQLGEDPADSVRILGARARHVHLSTCILDPGHPLGGDQHPPFAHPDAVLSVEGASLALAEALVTDPTEDRIIVASVEIRPGASEDPSDAWARTRQDLLSITALAQARADATATRQLTS